MHNQSQENRVPEYLKPYIAKQDPNLYTAIDHAVWRYILKISKAFLSKQAHQKYLDGLKETGISSERIPLIEEMNECLEKFNWQAVPVVGFIPPAVFMEFLSLGILPIACDMRTLEHLAYTPAPDIVHEAAGHAPIIADPEYAAYLRHYGEISRKAIFSSQDMEVYQAIRNLSDVKEDPHSSAKEIQLAQDKLDHALASVTYDSEATFLSRMGWWTFEYGLVGSVSNPKIYGAGLLSSVSESYHCLDPSVKKIPFSIQCVETSYDITRPQPQLFVAPNFKVLEQALTDLGNGMAFKKGGTEGLEKAKQAGTVTTTVLDSGVQISGVLKNWLIDQDGKPCFLQWVGPCQIAIQDQEIEGQGADYHREGYSTPLEEITDELLKSASIVVGKKGKLELQSGVILEGTLTNILRQSGKILVLSFKDCLVKKGTQILFQPEWGVYDIVSGRKVISVFGGAADRQKYLATVGGFHQEPGRQKSNLTDENRPLNLLYSQLRKMREKRIWDLNSKAKLEEIYTELENNFPNDWLLRYEILELLQMSGFQFTWKDQVWSRLNDIANNQPDIRDTIQRGLSLLK